MTPFPEIEATELIHFTPPRCPAPRKLADILRATCRVFDITMSELTGQQRRRAVSAPRHIAMWLATKHTEMSLPQIARHFNKRDHTTVMYARRKIDWLRLSDPNVGAAIKRIREEMA